MKVSHYIPLIGPYVIAAKKLNWDSNEIYSFNAFKANEQHISHNDSNKRVQYLDEENEDLIKEVSPCSDMTAFAEACSNISPSNIVASVCPCAGLSRLNSCSSENSSKGRGSDAVQNNWIYSAAKFYLATNSDVLVIENAPALASDKGVPIIENIQRICKDNNFDRKIQLVRTSTIRHGIPQNRGRSFIFVHKNDKFIRLKNKVHSSNTIENYLKQMPKIDNDFSITDTHKYSQMWLSFLKKNDWIIDKIKESIIDKAEVSFSVWPFIIEKIYPEHPDLFKDFPDLQKEYNYKRAKLNDGLGYWDGSPVFLKGKTNAVISKNAFRVLNPLKNIEYLTFGEMSHLMGLPFDFKLVDPKKNFNHIYQSIPISTAMDSLLWAEEIVSGKNTVDYNGKFLVQNNLKGDLENSFLDDYFKPIDLTESNEYTIFGST